MTDFLSVRAYEQKVYETFIDILTFFQTQQSEINKNADQDNKEKVLLH